MQNKNWILGLVVVVVAIVALGIWGFRSSVKPQVAGQSTSSASYYDDNASVMYFYSDYCSHCVAQKSDLEKLATDGYRVKPMNVGEHEDYWQKYSIEGTPTFVAANGDKLVGHQDITKLKSFLDSHK